MLEHHICCEMKFLLYFTVSPTAKVAVTAAAFNIDKAAHNIS